MYLLKKSDKKLSNINTAYLRLENDLIELKNLRMSTKCFNTKMSNIIYDKFNEEYKMFVSMESLTNNTHIFKVMSILTLSFYLSLPRIILSLLL